METRKQDTSLTPTSGWTPGPWRLDRYALGWAVYGQPRDTERSTGTLVADCRDGGPNIESASIAANARLIAAAPALVEALLLTVAMLRIEANEHRSNGSPKKAEAVEGAIRTATQTLQQAGAL